MARSADDFSQQIRSQLKITDPDLSAEPGSPERKIIDTVAEVLADSQSDQFVLQYQYDVDTKVGADLDKLVAMYGFARQGGNRATGIVTFSTGSPASSDTVIPIGTTVLTAATSVTPAVSFVTSANAVLYAGTTAVDAPIQASNVGLSGNVAASAISVLGGSAISVISAVNNAVATSGGTTIETDAELRVRFKNTIFRNVSGTTDQYLAIALSSQFTNKANVIGPLSRFIEYLQVPAGLTITSQIPYSKYTYNFDYYLTQTSVGATEIFFTPAVDYSFSNAVPPTATVLKTDSTRDFQVGSVLLLEHSYCSTNSRNVPASGINNYVDVYVSGSDPQAVVESCTFPTSANNLVSNPGSPFYVSNYTRVNTGAAAIVGDRLQPLLWQPLNIITSGTPVVISGNTYKEGIDYWFVRDTTITKGSKRARDGIEWGSGVTGAISAGTNFQLTYTFNELIILLNELMDAHKQITTDVLVHAATNRYFNINLVVMYTPGFSRSAVDASLTSSLTDFFQKLSFGAVIQISDVLETSHEVAGVDNVRLTTATDSATYGIQEYATNGVTLVGTPYTNDFALQDSDLPVLNQVVTIRKSQNTW